MTRSRNRRWIASLVLTVGGLVLGATLAGCDSGGSSRPDLSADGAADQIRASIDGLGESLRTMEGGAFSTRLKEFLRLQNGDARSGDWAGELIAGLETVLQTTDGRFDFSGSTGTYAWDAGQRSWEQRGSSENIVLRFPATETSQSNNATFTLSEYDDTGVPVDQETVYLPTAGNASLSVDGTEVFSVGLGNVAYDTESGLAVPIPQSLTLDVLTAPHTHLFELTSNGSTEYTFSFTLRNDDQSVAGLSTSVLLATANYDELQPTDVEELSGEVRIGPDLAVPYSIQVGELAGFDDPSEQQINDRVDATVVYNGQELATLRYDKSAEEIEVVFGDGSAEPASAFYEDFLQEMESAWSDYTGGQTDPPSIGTIRKGVLKIVRP
jgi:hypothetical protein